MTIVFLTHAFAPDPAAVGQHMADLARTLAQRGHRIVVITSDRGYDDASVQFPRHETTTDGVVIHRLANTSFGKATLLRRAAAILSFMLQSAIITARTDPLDGIVFSTSPPFIGTIATIVSMLRRVPTAFWAMDLNPDQLIALGKLAADGIPARILHRLNRFPLRRASLVVALDPLMAARLIARGANASKLLVTPPWSPDEALAPVPRSNNRFREKHRLTSSTVVMYSGNHTRSNPLTTLLAAALALRDVANLTFVFIGSGVAKRDIDQAITQEGLSNVLSLPYQPKSEIAESLSAADVHVVSLGAQMAGVIHPCKVYGAMAVARPILYFGPSPSHVSAIILESDNGWRVQHGDIAGAISVLCRIAAAPFAELDEMGSRGRAMIQERFRPQVLVNAIADAIDRAFTTGDDGEQ